MNENTEPTEEILVIENPEETPKSKKKKLTPEEKEAKIQLEKELLLKKIHTGEPFDTKDKVALILSRNINSRNSDIELAWEYWKTFHPELFDGTSLIKKTFLKLPKISSLCRSRAKIQNEYKLFLADEEVQQQRGVLEVAYRKRAIKDKAPIIKSIFVYIDETGKNQDYLSLGSLWLPTYSPNTVSRIDEIKTWKKLTEIQYEFHFSELSNNKLDDYKNFIIKFLSLFPEASFKTILIRNRGLGPIEQAIKTLTYYLIKKGITHENDSNRAPLPRRLQVFLDNEDEVNDALKIEFIKDQLTAQNIEGLTLGDFAAVESRNEIFIQVVDLFTGAINRKLHHMEGENVKDKFANFLLEILELNIDDYLNDRIDGDNTKMFSYLKNN